MIEDTPSIKLSSLSQSCHKESDYKDSKDSEWDDTNNEVLPFKLEYLDTKGSFNSIPFVLIRYKAPNEWYINLLL